MRLSYPFPFWVVAEHEVTVSLAILNLEELNLHARPFHNTAYFLAERGCYSPTNQSTEGAATALCCYYSSSIWLNKYLFAARRCASAIYAVVYLSVTCPYCIVPKRLSGGSRKQWAYDSPGPMFSVAKYLGEIPLGSPQGRQIEVG